MGIRATPAVVFNYQMLTGNKRRGRNGSPRPWRTPAIIAVFAGLLSACDRNSDRMEITVKRPIFDGEAPIELDATPYQRYLSAVIFREYDWETPPGWTEAQPTEMRHVQFQIGPNSEATCAVFQDRKGPGSIENQMNGNLARWITQFDPPPKPVKNEAITINGITGRKLLLEGNYVGMRRGPAIPDAAMLGAIVMDSHKYITVKMTGPAELVRAEEKNFDAFCQSLKVLHFSKRIVGEHRKARATASKTGEGGQPKNSPNP